MNNINSTNLSFRSTIVPINTKKPIMVYFERLKNCDLKSMQNKSIEDCYKELFNNAKNAKYQTGVMLDKESFPFIRFIGYNKENDEYIFKQLKKIDSDTRYIKDIPDDGFEHGTIELLI